VLLGLGAVVGLVAMAAVKLRSAPAGRLEPLYNHNPVDESQMEVGASGV
jgi:hypothetical protein